MDIFNTENVSDLPDNLQNELSGDHIYMRLSDLINSVDFEVTAQQVLVAYYRRYKKCLKIRQVYSLLDIAHRKNLIEKAGRAKYKGIKND